MTDQIPHLTMGIIARRATNNLNRTEETAEQHYLGAPVPDYRAAVDAVLADLPDTAVIAEALAKHDLSWQGGDHPADSLHLECACGIAWSVEAEWSEGLAHQADAVLDLWAARDREVAAKALREAAADLRDHAVHEEGETEHNRLITQILLGVVSTLNNRIGAGDE